MTYAPAQKVETFNARYQAPGHAIRIAEELGFDLQLTCTCGWTLKAGKFRVLEMARLFHGHLSRYGGAKRHG